MTNCLYKPYTIAISKLQPKFELPNPTIKACLISFSGSLSLQIMKMRMGAQDMKLKELKRALKEQKARLYIIRRCVAMLIRWHD
uniref:Uncharacterized protein n=1 Tax=Oryza punctata TaxID=4537 RepID=A0A0E0LZK6_ORYPU